MRRRQQRRSGETAASAEGQPSFSDTNGTAGEVAAMQFAGGLSIARIAEAWERDADWVEASIRRALLETIPKRSGGLKASRAELRAERREDGSTPADVQGELEW